MASINSKSLPVPLTSDLVRLLGLAAKRGYSDKALEGLALSYIAAKKVKTGGATSKRKAVRRHA